MKEEIRRVGANLLSGAFVDRQAAQRRVWEAADEVNRLREQLGRAEAILATEERWLGDAQETLRAVWEDFNPRTGHLTALDGPSDAGTAVSVADPHSGDLAMRPGSRSE